MSFQALSTKKSGSLWLRFSKFFLVVAILVKNFKNIENYGKD